MVSFAVIAVIYSQSVTPMFHAYFCLGDSAFDTLQSRKKITLKKKIFSLHNTFHLEKSFLASKV